MNRQSTYTSRLKTISEALGQVFLLSPILYLAGAVGNSLRAWYYRRRLKQLGKGAIIDIGAIILNPQYVSIGDNAWIDKYTILLAGPPDHSRKIYRKKNVNYKGQEGEIHIGSNTHIAPHVLLQGHGGLWLGDNMGVASGSRIYTFSHHYRDLTDRDNPRLDYKFTPLAPREDQALILGSVVIDDDSAVGLNSVVLPGVTIAKGSWIGSMSLVTRDIPSNVVASGVPAEVVKAK